MANRLAIVVCLLVGGCFGSEHPDRSRYEYLYADGVFQGSFTSFPVGAERVGWMCFDRKLNREFNCTMVRGGWEHFKYIYRKRL